MQIAAIIISIGLLLSLFLGIGMITTGLRNARSSRLARSWPTTQGLITHSGITKEQQENDSILYTADVRYRYTVGGTQYNGSKLRFDSWTTSDMERATKEAARYPAQSNIAVHYDPANPATSVLEPDMGSATSVMLTAGIGLVATALILGVIAATMFLPAR